MTRLSGVLAAWIPGLMLVFAGIKINEPYLVSLHGPGVAAVIGASVAVLVWLIVRACRNGRSVAGDLLIGLWCLPILSVVGADLAFLVRKQQVLNSNLAEAHILGPHFIVGYSSFAEAAPLAEKGLIAGLYITRHNIAGRTAEAVKSEIAALQALRRSAALPPLIVAADQEGGIVSHLSPPLTALPALASLAELPPEIRAERAEQVGRRQGQELAALGVNQDLAPVLDLRPETSRSRLDFNTLIGQRAIAADPAIVAELALAYVRGLEAFDVTATLKHFPGLGRVRSDTHYFDARLDASPEVLESSDWRPFRDVLAGSNAQLMIGHVALTAVDPDRPASHSKRVVDGIIRRKWNYQGVIMTDDLVMGAIYHHDVCTAVVEALNAGVDLLLVAYDGSQFYRIFGCAAAAARQGRLDAAMLRASDARLKRTLPLD